MSDHTPEPWDFYSHGNPPCYEVQNETHSIAPGIWNRDDAVRIVRCVNACRGLSDEQVTAIPRLVAWFTGVHYDAETLRKELLDLERLYPSVDKK